MKEKLQSQYIDRKVFEALTDESHIKVLLYLEKFNPDVTIENLKEDLNMNLSLVVDILNSFIKLGLIEEEGRLFKLTDYGKFIISKI